MPSFINTFQYTGLLQQAIIPAGTTHMDVYLWGGAGGGGGGDRSGPGRPGASGHFVSATNIDLTSYKGSTLTVAVGGGGGGGSTGGGAPGGNNGRSITGYSGGIGGHSGPSGYSGSGGGGGGASVIKIDTNPLVVAGGGGGGGGDALYSQGSEGQNSNSAAIGPLGENGGPHNGDGGGGGAGGGGAFGGIGGNGGGGDNGGAGGYSGSNLVPAGGTSDDGSHQLPGGTGSTVTIDSEIINLYQSGIAVGGDAVQAGGNGLVVIVFNTSLQSKTKVGNEWKNLKDIKFKTGGVWKNIREAYIKTYAGWKVLFSTGLNFIPTSAGFGDAEGAGFSGTPGSGGEGGGGRVICTWLQNKGMFSAEDLAIDTAFSVKYIGRTTKIGYWFWACPLVEYMTKAERTNNKFGSLVIKTIRILAQARANELAYKMGRRDKGDLLGKFTRLIGESFCFMVGFLVRPFVEKKFSHWLKIYDAK